MSRMKHILSPLVVVALLCSCFGEELPTTLSMQEIAERAVREAAEKAAKEKAEAEATAKATAEAAAKEAAEATVKAAVEKAAKEAASAAAAAAAESTAKQMVDEKAEQEKADAKAKEQKEEKKEELRQIDTQIFRLNNASAEDVAEKLNAMWNGEFGQVWKVTKMAVPFPESNSIIVTAPRMILTACEKAVQALDVEAQQVYIEARFVELGNTASHKVGIDWAMMNGITLTGTAQGGYQSVRLGNGVSDYSYSEGGGTVKKGATSYTLKGFLDANNRESSDASITMFNGTLSLSQMSLTLMALDASGDTKMFANPKIIVSSGKKATVDMTTKYPTVKVSTKRTTGVSDSVDIASEMMTIPGEDKMMFAKEAFFSWGISLDVTPRIGTNGLINVTIVPTISDIDSWVETGTTMGDEGGTLSSKYPSIKVQRLITEFSLESGSTAVIGGLSRTEEVQVDNGIPILREIPWIGPRLFGSMIREKVQREIIVFVTVGLVDPHAVKQDAGLPKNAVLGRQYTEGQKLEPGDRPEKNMEGFDSLDMRQLEEQAKDPLRQNGDSSSWNLNRFNPFSKDPKYQRPKGHIEKSNAK